jgi:hypothetical protein
VNGRGQPEASESCGQRESDPPLLAREQRDGEDARGRDGRDDQQSVPRRHQRIEEAADDVQRQKGGSAGHIDVRAVAQVERVRAQEAGNAVVEEQQGEQGQDRNDDEGWPPQPRQQCDQQHYR